MVEVGLAGEVVGEEATEEVGVTLILSVATSHRCLAGGGRHPMVVNMRQAYPIGDMDTRIMAMAQGISMGLTHGKSK